MLAGSFIRSQLMFSTSLPQENSEDARFRSSSEVGCVSASEAFPTPSSEEKEDMFSLLPDLNGWTVHHSVPQTPPSTPLGGNSPRGNAEIERKEALEHGSNLNFNVLRTRNVNSQSFESKW